MLCLKTLGSVTRPRTAITFVAATLLVGAAATEASAKSRHHRHHHHHRHHAQTDTNATSDWRNANASMTPTSGTGRSFSGMASFYGNESGSKTASGQRFNQNAMTAAHRSLPFGTKLRVTDTSSGRFVTVRVNDRGPFVRGRVVDVSPSAAEALGMVDKGITTVRLEVVQ